ncbi:MAG: Asp-tRNA(Asn)/Glu-tRNA(Gln) amidotransferase subunit GatC [Candidatus Nanopelagicales bacterium]
MTSETGNTLDVAAVARLAELARISLSDEELQRYSGQLDQILHSVDKVGEVAADDVVPMSHPQPLVNVTRPDVNKPCVDREEVLRQAPAVEDDRFRVPQILGEE